MNKYKIPFIASLFLVLLSACGGDLTNEISETENQEETVEKTQTNENIVQQNQLGEEYYNFVLDENGNYATSNSRGITLSLNSGINIRLFEKDLLRFSQQKFSTDQYFIMEGQLLDNNLVRSWLRRLDPEAEGNPLYAGLNPAQDDDFYNEETEAYNHSARIPNYLNSILELDFYRETEDGVELAGLTIGLAMNTVEYYQDNDYTQFEQPIAPEVALKQGQNIGNEIVARLREMEGLENIPIMVAIYEQTAQDDLAGGVYKALGTSTNGATSISSWETLNEERLVFPLEGSSSAEGNAFANFQSEVEYYFPNLSGVTGRAHYVNNQLVDLKIDIMTQFYGETEMISFTQYLKQSALTFLPADIDVEINVQSSTGMEAFLKKERTDAEYFAYVFD